MNSDIVKYKENICKLASKKDFQKYQYNYGHTSTIYKIKNEIIKEIYLPSNDLTKTNKLSELQVTIFIEENFPEYAIPFYGYDICNKRLYMKFEYVGKSLAESILDYSVRELKKIYNKIIETINILNTKVNHNDLNTYNIYVVRNPLKSSEFKIIFGDWGKSSLKENSKENSKDKEYFSKEFFKRLISSYYFKDHSLSDLRELMIKEKFYSNFVKYFNNEKKYIMRKYYYCPKKFTETVFRYYYHLFLTNYIFNNYGEEFLIKHIKFTPTMKTFLNFIESEI